MEAVKKHSHYIISALAIVGITFAAMNFTNPPLFQNTDNFVLFASEEIKLEQGVQVSSGDLGSNGEIDVEKDNIINGNLFADGITLDKNVTVNGNASFNKLKTHKETKILGTQTKPVSLPVANLPEIPDFQVGTQDFKFTGQNNTLIAGNYRDIVIEKNSRFTLTGGIYNLRKLELKENSTLIFNSPTTLNIQFKLKGQEHVAILPTNNNLKPTDLVINYLGIRPKNEKEEKEDDDEEINALHDDKEKKDHKEGKIGRPVIFGKNSFLNFKLMAIKAGVKIGEASTLRGQILARKVKVGEGAILSQKLEFEKESDLTKIVEANGAKFLLNEIIILFENEVTENDIQVIASLVGGRVIGIIPMPKIYKIEVSTITVQELNNKIQIIKNLNSQLIIQVSPNFISR